MVSSGICNAYRGQKFCDADKRDPLVSPVYADFDGMPPTLVHVGDHEILLSDSIRMVERMRECGRDIELQVWPDMWHVFQFFVGQMPESDRSIASIADYLKRRLSPAASQGQAA